MSQQTAKLLMIVSVMVTFGLVTIDMIANHRIQKFLGKDNTTNWLWKDSWTNNTTPIIPEETQPSIVPDIKDQIVASSYEDAIKKSEETGKPVVIIFGAHWCHWCQKMDTEVLVSEQVKSALKNYIFLKIDTDQNKVVTQKFQISGLPSYIIIDSKESKLKSGSGYKSIDNFTEWLNDQNLTSPKADVPETNRKHRPQIRHKSDIR